VATRTPRDAAIRILGDQLRRGESRAVEGRVHGEEKVWDDCCWWASVKCFARKAEKRELEDECNRNERTEKMLLLEMRRIEDEEKRR
jgi:hypothetical protein